MRKIYIKKLTENIALMDLILVKGIQKKGVIMEESEEQYEEERNRRRVPWRR